jgi:excisionase family DNA binding protein
MSWLELGRFVTADEFARRLSVSSRTVQRSVARGYLRGIRLNHRGKILIPQSELRRLLLSKDREGDLEDGT